MWSQKSTLALIEDIRVNPCLWDTQSKDFKRRAKKTAVYRALGDKYCMNGKEIELKFQALKNQFRREHKRLEKYEAGLSPKQIHWFGYEPLLFLLNNCVKPQAKIELSDTQEALENSDTEYTEYVEYEALEETKPAMTAQPIKFTKQTSQSTATASEAFKCMRTLAEKVCTRDEFDIYGEYLAYKLRDSGRSTREIAVAQHEINTICFKLCMGEFAQREGSLEGSVHSDPVAELAEGQYMQNSDSDKK